MAFLVAADGTTHPLRPEGITLGRSPKADVVIDTALASRRHVRIGLEGERWIAEDLGSRNGTRHNGRPLQGSVGLSEGDKLEAGGLSFAVRIGGESGAGRRRPKLALLLLGCVAVFVSVLGAARSLARPTEQAVAEVAPAPGIEKPDPLPACDGPACLQQARELFAAAERNRANHVVAPRNLFDAWTALRKAERLLAGLEPRPALHGSVVALQAEVGERLDERCAQLRFTATRHFALGELPRAEAAAEELLRFFPGDEHTCHGVARRMLARLGEDRR